MYLQTQAQLYAWRVHTKMLVEVDVHEVQGEHGRETDNLLE